MNYAEYKEQVLGEHGAAARKRQHLEDDLQKKACGFLRWALPDDACWWHVPNGGKRHTLEAQRMTALGVRAGIPDIHIVYRGRLHCIELKAPDGQLSAVQVQMIEKLLKCGVPVVVCRSEDAVEQALREWCIPVAARLT